MAVPSLNTALNGQNMPEGALMCGIVGPCQSACTVLLGHIPRSRICVTPEASFGFHLAKRADATATLRRAYAADITGWINAHGGLTQDFIWTRAPDTYRYFKKC
jgi:hypothetical protein